MSLKNVEMQIAIPKTVDAGKFQHEQNNRAQVLNAQTHIAVEKNDEQKRKTVLENHEANKLRRNKDEGENRQAFFSQDKAKKRKRDKTKESHPFKGKFIDYRG